MSPLQLSLVHFWSLDCEEEKGPVYALRMPVQSLSHKKLADRSEARAKVMKRRITGRFKGLLEVNRRENRLSIKPRTVEEKADQSRFSLYNLVENQSKVDFLHRTVRDFLYTSECRQILSCWAPPTFNVNYSLSLAFLADMKEYWELNGMLSSLRRLQYCQLHSSWSYRNTKIRRKNHPIRFTSS
jgi:hypothetical protein